MSNINTKIDNEVNVTDIGELLTAFDNASEDIECCSSYGEPGYSVESGKAGILFANWNNVESELADKLEKRYEIEWSDEWLIDYDNDKAYRTQPDSYDWIAAYQYNDDGELFTAENIVDYEEDYLEFIINSTRNCNLFISDDRLRELGFEKVNVDSYEAGLHKGQDDDPGKILTTLLKKQPGQYVFSNLVNSQFTTSYDLYFRENQIEE